MTSIDKEKTSATTSTDSNNSSSDDWWVQATDWDDPLKTAVLFKSVENSNNSGGCGHAIQWNSKYLVSLKSCPICQAAVALICDGSVIATTSASTETDDADGDSSSPKSIITCKYGKQVYRLSVMAPKEEETSANASSSTRSNWSLFGSKQSLVEDTTITAQDRICQALGLVEGFRILYKGKVIYPSTSNDTSPLEISKKLLQLSEFEWNAPKGKKYMVVMGTQHGKELAPNTNSDNRNQKSFSFSQLIWLPVYVVKWGLGGAWWFFFSLFEPFIPQAYLPSSEQDNDDHED